MKYSEVDTIRDFSNFLRCDLNFIQKAITNEYFIRELNNFNVLENIKLLREEEIFVSKFDIKKKGKNGGYRTVHAVWTDQLNNSLKILNNNLNDIFVPFQNIHGFVKGKNIKSNADSHLSKKTILSVDIKDYFETISKEMIIESLVKLGFKKHVASWIADITTINNNLVQGFCTSPTLANIVTHSMDKELINFCSSKITYTRYADDLYFSSDVEEIHLDQIERIINSTGFVLNYKKTKWMKRGQNQYVTGLTTFDSNYSRIAKKKKRNIRLEIYYISKFGYKNHVVNKLKKRGEDPESAGFLNKVIDEISLTRNKLYGWLHFIKAVEPKFAIKYYKKLNEL